VLFPRKPFQTNQSTSCYPPDHDISSMKFLFLVSAVLMVALVGLIWALPGPDAVADPDPQFGFSGRGFGYRGFGGGFGHRGFGHRGFGHRGFGHRGFGHGGFGYRGFG
ncbi:hypothetical protein OTU49_002129, partial [Cherax quadricarinatus]